MRFDVLLVMHTLQPSSPLTCVDVQFDLLQVMRCLQLQRRTQIQWNNLMMQAMNLEEVEENMRDPSCQYKSSQPSSLGLLRLIYTPTVGKNLCVLCIGGWGGGRLVGWLVRLYILPVIVTGPNLGFPHFPSPVTPLFMSLLRPPKSL